MIRWIRASKRLRNFCALRKPTERPQRESKLDGAYIAQHSATHSNPIHPASPTSAHATIGAFTNRHNGLLDPLARLLPLPSQHLLHALAPLRLLAPPLFNQPLLPPPPRRLHRVPLAQITTPLAATNALRAEASLQDLLHGDYAARQRGRIAQACETIWRYVARGEYG